MELSSDRRITSVRNHVKGGVYLGPLMSDNTSSLNDLERVFKTPDFQCSYTKHPLHPLTRQYSDISHDWLASLGVKKQMGPKLWNNFVTADTPQLIGFVHDDTEPQYFLWVCKLCALLFAVDDKVEDAEWASSQDNLCKAILDFTRILLWNDPEEKRIQEYLGPMYKNVTTEESRARLQMFHADVLHAKRESKSLMDIELDHNPLASAFRDLWIEYIGVVPAEFVSREAKGIQAFLCGCMWEGNNRRTRQGPKDLNEYFAIRRMTVVLQPFVVCADMLVALHKDSIPQIPNSLFEGPQMQAILVACEDIIGWHNCIHSFAKELKDEAAAHNLVKMLCRQYNCASYTEAGKLALELLHDRIAEMELLYENLLSVAPIEFHPAIDLYMTECRNWICGSHEWHILSTRYKVLQM